MRPPLVPPRPHSWIMSDGYVLTGRLWTPDVPASGDDYREAAGHAADETVRWPMRVILYLHGIQSHGGWFEWSASRLAAAGHVVLLPDRRGSGQNVDRGHTPSARRWLLDLDELADWAQSAFPDRPLDVVGVSWGGKLATVWSLRNPNRLQRLLLIAPGIFPAVDVGLATRVAIGVSLLLHPRRQFLIPLNDPALFTDTPAGREFIARDPLRLTHATARFLFESARLDRWLAAARRGTLAASVTLVLAGRERIICNEPTLRWLKRVAVRPPAVHLFPEACHTIEFEQESGGFAAVLDAWARERT